ncbi:MAG: hypothetical protein MJZ91_09735 [Bacteroidales bacterium]|nr:hypothetical protein [Bacteroidales bacterium]
MNRHIIRVLTLAVIAVIFASCKKTKPEWTNFYGYTPSDLAGTYVFSQSEDAFKSFTEGPCCILCEDAQINITGVDDSPLRFNINCPDHNYSRSFLGKAPMNPDDFLIDIRGRRQWQGSSKFIQNRLQSRVLRNSENRIRLVGSGIMDAYDIKVHFIYNDMYQIIDTISDTVFTSSTNYFFDVIKEE